MTGETNTVDALRAQYRELVIKWDEARDQPKTANRLFDSLHAFYKQIRESETGREAIIGLLGDPITAIQLSAATHSLAWEPARATAILEEIEQGDSLFAVDAKWTLCSFRNGKLNLDW